MLGWRRAALVLVIHIALVVSLLVYGAKMALDREQKQNAKLIYSLAKKRGLSDKRAKELVAAAYSESGLRTRATNKSSGAAGLFQLLSPHYREKAAKLGGLYNPRANTLAILPDYIAYWRDNPNARPGEGGRDVERSGEGADFYAKALGMFGWLGKGTGGLQPSRGTKLSHTTNRPEVEALREQTKAALAQDLIAASQARARGESGGPSRYIASLRAHQEAMNMPMVEHQQPTKKVPGLKKTPGWVTKGGKIIGTPYAGTHSLGNWQSDNAVDIGIPEGTPIFAVADGVIGPRFGKLSSSNPRFAGLRLTLQGKKNQWYYAHLSAFAKGIRPGARVKKGQLIGWSGEANGVAHLHFAALNGDPRRWVK